MDPIHRMKRAGIAAIVFAVSLRLWSGGLPDIAAFLISSETGRNVRFSASSEVFSPHFAESPPPSLPKAKEVPLPSFSGEILPQITNLSHAAPDLAALLARPLSWDLTEGDPAVLILHTHSTESYTKKAEVYKETSAWRTLDENYNMLSMGAALAQLLEEAGIPTIQDRELHDYPSYNGSYTHARKSIRELLKEHPTISLVLDLHRDASGEGAAQMRTRAKVGEESSAQLMVVLGTNHKGYEENLSLGLKLHALLEDRHPGLMRPLQLRSQRFNQDLSPGALLIEVGAAGNSHGEALTAVKALAEGIIALARGSEA